jgi:orotate phosphoribosyltransferase
LLSSGLHSEQYLQSALVLQQPDIATKLCLALAEHFKNSSIEVVIAPALGGVFVSHETARALGVRALFAERVHGELSLRRGFTIKPGERVLVVEDVITTGKSTKETIEVVRKAGGSVCGLQTALWKG